MPYSAVIFDLDGTLVNSLDDIADAANQVLRDVGRPTHEVLDYRQFIGHGVSVLFERALADREADPALVADCVARFRRLYRDHWDVKTRCYRGVPELLAQLQRGGLPLAVLSNKPHEFTVRCVARFFPQVPFIEVLGQRDGVPAKPHPGGALEIARRCGVAPAAVVYVGDSGVDMQTATQAGMLPVGCLWGFRPRDELQAAGARVLIAHPQELLAVLQERPRDAL